MPYIGNPIYQSAFVTDQFNGDGSTVAFTMSVAPAGVSNVLVAVSGVLQDPSTYGVAGNTITFSTAPPSGTGNISCRYLGVPVTGIVTTAYRTVTEFTATASQTTFTPPSYTVGFINVYLNGVLLGSADYTATNGTTVVLATGASAGNLVTVESFRVETVLNALSNSAGSVSASNLAGGSVTDSKLSLTTPALGTPSAINLSNATALPRTAMPSGSVIQTVYAVTTTEVSTGSTSFVSCGLSGSITPTASGNKFIITVMGTARTDGGSPTAELRLTLYKNGSNVTGGDGLAYMCNNSTSNGMDMPLSFTYYDTAASASSITYAVYIRDGAGRNSRFPSAVNMSPKALMIIQEVVQ